MEDLILKLQSDFETVKELIMSEMPHTKYLEKKKWEKISQSYSMKIEQVLKYQILQSYCIFDFIIGTKHSDVRISKNCKSMINALNDEIIKALSFIESNPSFCKAVNNIITEMFTTMDVDVQSKNSAFKSWVNELFVFNKLTNISNYTLIEMERVLSNKKSIDYVLKHNETDEELLIEVITFQNIDPTKHVESDTFNSYLNGRIREKYDSKMKELTKPLLVRVLPIIEYKDGMEEFEINIDNTISVPALTVGRNKVGVEEEIALFETKLYLSQIKKQNACS